MRSFFKFYVPFFVICTAFGLWIFYFSTDKIKDIYFFSGLLSALFLAFSFFVCKARFGIFSFLFAFLHTLNYIFLDKLFEFSQSFEILLEILDDFLHQKFLIFGGLSFLIMSFLFVFSFFKIRLRSKWLFSLSYLAFLFFALHYFWAQKTADFYDYLIVIFAGLLFAIRLKRLFSQMIGVK